MYQHEIPHFASHQKNGPKNCICEIGLQRVLKWRWRDGKKCALDKEQCLREDSAGRAFLTLFEELQVHKNDKKNGYFSNDLLLP